MSGWSRWLREPLLEGLLEAFDLALVCGCRRGRSLDNPRRASSASNAVRPPWTFWEANRTVYTIPLSVNVLAGMPCSA